MHTYLVKYQYEDDGSITIGDNGFITSGLVIEITSVTMPELTHYGFDGLHGYTKANKVYRRDLIKKAKAAVGITHLRGLTSVEKDGVYHFKPTKRKTLLTIAWVKPD